MMWCDEVVCGEMGRARTSKRVEKDGDEEVEDDEEADDKRE